MALKSLAVFRPKLSELCANDGFLTVEAEISVIVNGKSSLEKICRNLFFSVPKRKLVGYHFMRKNAQNVSVNEHVTLSYFLANL